jgi:hypothetical protein
MRYATRLLGFWSFDPEELTASFSASGLDFNQTGRSKDHIDLKAMLLIRRFNSATPAGGPT